MSELESQLAKVAKSTPIRIGIDKVEFVETIPPHIDSLRFPEINFFQEAINGMIKEVEGQKIIIIKKRLEEMGADLDIDEELKNPSGRITCVRTEEDTGKYYYVGSICETFILHPEELRIVTFVDKPNKIMDDLNNFNKMSFNLYYY